MIYTKENKYDLFIQMMELEKCNPDDYLFGRGLKTSNQQFINPNHISTTHLKLCREIGIRKECTLYSWKHTGAAALYRLTKDPYLVMRHLRHHDFKMTMFYLKSLGFGMDSQLNALNW